MADMITQIAAVENALVLSEPGANEVIRVQLGEQPLQFQFNLDSATFAIEGNDLVITFANGGKIIVEDYVTDAPLGAGSIVAADGSELVPADIAVRLEGAKVVEAPGANEVSTIEVGQNEALIFNFDPASAQIEVSGDDLILVFADGGRIVLEGFFAPGGESGYTPLTLLSDGSLLSGDLITALAVEPAAGPAAQTELEGPQEGSEGGGGQFEAPSLTDINSLDPLGPIGNEEFGSSVPEPIANDTFGNTEAGAVKVGEVADGGPLVDEAGDIVNYTVFITNTGDQALTGVVVNDPLVALSYASGDLNGNNELDPGETWVYTGSYVVPQSVIDNNGGGDGDIDNTVTVTTNETEFTASHEVGIFRNPGLTIEKTAQVLSDNEPAEAVTSAGDVVHYTIVVTNTGNVTLTGVELDDPLLDSLQLTGGDLDNDGNLDVGEVWTYEGDYVVTQADIDSNGGGDGDIDNVATVDTNETGPASDSAEVEIAARPALNIDKVGVLVDGNESGYADAGEIISYTLTVSNTGNVSLTNVTVTDPDADFAPVLDSGDDGDGVLEVGETWIYTAQHTLTQEEIDSGSFTNVATADSDESDPDDDDHTETLDANPGIELSKSSVLNVEGETAPVEGDTITYTFTISNTGNVTLDNVTLTDALLSLGDFALAGQVTGDADNDGELDVGETWTYTQDYDITQADIDNGGVFNEALAEGEDPSDTPVSDDDDNNQPLAQDPGIEIAKSGQYTDSDGNEGITAGDVIEYTFVITNTGNVTLDNVTLDDAKLGLVSYDVSSAITLAEGDLDQDGALDVGEVWTITFDGADGYEITQDDINAGEVANTVLVTADDPSDGPVTDEDDDLVTLLRNPDIMVEKDGVLNDGGDGADAGDTITYSFTVTNTGNVTLDTVALSDVLAGLGPINQTDNGNGDLVLDPGEVWTYEATYVVTQDDMDAGVVDNLVTVTADDPEDVEVSDDDDDSVTLTQTAGIDILKTGSLSDGGDGVDPSDTISYTFVITNTGNVTLENVTLDDAKLGLVAYDVSSAITLAEGDLDQDGALDVGEVWTITFDGADSYDITQADIDAGQVDNTVEVTADQPIGDPVSDTDDETVPLAQNPEIQIVKGGVFNDDGEGVFGGNGFAEVGETITYTFTVTNIGNVTLDMVSVTDPLTGLSAITYVSGDTGDDEILSVGEEWVFTASYTLDADDLDAGQVDNTATASAEDPDDAPVEDTDDETVTFAVNEPPVILPGDVEGDVWETALPVGCDPDSDAETDSGFFTVSDSDGTAANVTLSSVKVTDVFGNITTVNVAGLTAVVIYTFSDAAASTDDTDGTLVGSFTLTRSGTTWNWEYTLINPVPDLPDGDPAEVETFEVIVVDEGGAFSSAEIVANVEINDATPEGGIENVVLANSLSANVSGSFMECFDADGVGSLPDNAITFSPPAGFYVGDEITTGDTQELYIVATGDDSDDPSYILTVNADGTYTFDTIKTLPPTETFVDLGSELLGSNNPQPVYSGIIVGDYSLTFSAVSGTNVQPSNDGIGIDSNLVDNAERISIAFFQLDGSTPSLINDSTVTVGNMSNETLTWKTYVNGEWTGDSGTYNAPSVPNSTNLQFTLSGTLDGDGEMAAFDEVIFDGTGGSSGYKLLDITILDLENADDVNFSFEVATTDGDGDPATSTIDISIDGDDVIVGTSGDDTLDGTDGVDRFIGDLGSDTINLGDLTPNDGFSDSVFFSDAGEGVDSIFGFEAGAGGDVLDISMVLSGFTGMTVSDAVGDGFLQFTVNAGDVTVSVDSDGGADGFTDLAILDGATLNTVIASAEQAEAELAGNITVA